MQEVGGRVWALLLLPSLESGDITLCLLQSRAVNDLHCYYPLLSALRQMCLGKPNFTLPFSLCRMTVVMMISLLVLTERFSHGNLARHQLGTDGYQLALIGPNPSAIFHVLQGGDPTQRLRELSDGDGLRRQPHLQNVPLPGKKKKSREKNRSVFGC